MTDTDLINAVLDRLDAGARDGDWEALDVFVRDFPLTASTLELLALMRGSFAMREKLPSWQTKLKEVGAVVERLNPHLLRGLY